MPEPIVFHKPGRPLEGPPRPPWLAFLARLRPLVDQELDDGGLIFRGIVWLIFAWTGVGFLRASLSPEAVSGFWHLVNLPFHEAGHVLFGFLPRIWVSFMGTGGQLLMPLICLVVLYVTTKDKFGATICLWWFGQNFLDIAPYIDDARRGTLPLLGGNTGETSPYGFHDWNYILTEMKWLNHDHAIAAASWRAGKIIIAVALLWGAAILAWNAWRLHGRRSVPPSDD